METTKRVAAVAWETRGVLAGAYRGKRLEERTLLTHLVGLDERGWEVRVACGQNVDHMADAGSLQSVEQGRARPTCPRCGERHDRLVAKGVR